MKEEIVITQPDDFHVHLRDGEALELTVADVAKQFARATIMPNLSPAIDDASSAVDYLARIKKHIPKGSNFSPLMTVYLTEKLTAEELAKAKKEGVVAVKLYPQGVTTNSQQGVADIGRFDDIFSEMARLDIMLLIHGEVSDSNVDIFSRERIFLAEVLTKLVARHPKLKIVLEHITTAESVKFIESANSNIAATITPQHLIANRNNLLSGGIKPHYYCLPILKKESDRLELLRAATSGNRKFFLGTDSAPHSTSSKENSCGCAGCYTMPYAIELYADIFSSVYKIDKLDDFSSNFGAMFYNIERNKEKITIYRKKQIIKGSYSYLDDEITPFMSGQEIGWTKL